MIYLNYCSLVIFGTFKNPQYFAQANVFMMAYAAIDVLPGKDITKPRQALNERFDFFNLACDIKIRPFFLFLRTGNF